MGDIWGITNPFAVDASTEVMSAAVQVLATFFVVLVIEAVALPTPNRFVVVGAISQFGLLFGSLAIAVLLLWSMGAPAVEDPLSVGTVVVSVFILGAGVILLSSIRARLRRSEVRRVPARKPNSAPRAPRIAGRFKR